MDLHMLGTWDTTRKNTLMKLQLSSLVEKLKEKWNKLKDWKTKFIFMKKPLSLVVFFIFDNNVTNFPISCKYLNNALKKEVKVLFH